MNKRFFFIAVLIFFLGNQAHSQIFPRWASGFYKRLFFLKSIDTLRPKLSFYKRGTTDSPTIINVRGYVMDEYDLKNEHDLEIVLEEYWHPELTMTIDLHFEQLPESITYYLEIPKFNAEKTIKAVIPKKISKVTYLEDKRKSAIFKRDKVTWPPMSALDITDIVFPENAKKKEN